MSSKSRASLLGIIIGAVFGLGGIGSGIYFGIIAPLRDNGGAGKLPAPLIVGSLGLALALLVYLGYVWVTYARKRKQRPSEW